MALKRTVLVVEDNAINRGILAGILSEQYTVLEAENGLAALALLQQHGSDIALILLDMMMPVMDGCTFLAHLRKDEELALIPVIVTTQSDSEKDEEAALRHGATDFVRKPYRAQIIRQRVANLIHLRENAAMINQLRYDRLTGVYSKEYFCHLLAGPRHRWHSSAGSGPWRCLLPKRPGRRGQHGGQKRRDPLGHL